MTRSLRALVGIAAAIALSLTGVFASTTSAEAGTGGKHRAAADFDGIVALDNCSGSIVRWDDSAGGDQAMMLTNGHCYEDGFLDNGEVLVDQPSSRSVTLLGSDGSDVGQVQATRLIYATMTDTDVALYRLDTTYDQLDSDYGVQPLTMATDGPADGSAIQILSGYWKTSYSCSVDGHAYLLHEGEWTWKDSVRYSEPGCDTIHGTSGSPVIDPTSRNVVAINNTGNDDGERCTVNNPCEEDQDGNITYKKGNSYAEQTDLFYTCLGDDNAIDLSRAGCQLPAPSAEQEHAPAA